MFDLTTRDIQYLPGVGPQRAALLEKELGISSMHDLLYNFPYKYVDRSRLYYIHEIDGNMPYIQIKGKILRYETTGTGRKMRLVAHFSDGTGVIDLVWFNGAKFIPKNYPVGVEYIVFGKPTMFGERINVAHPDIDKASELSLSSMGLQPHYNTTERMKRSGLNSHAMQKLEENLFALIERTRIDETLPEAFVREHRLMPLSEALYAIHFPKDPEILRRAQYRLKFEELFYVQLSILRYCKDRRRKYRGLCFAKVGELFNEFYTTKLPFELTGAQKRVIREMRHDMNSGRQMNRLLQGDVGSGKTMVAAAAAYITANNGRQAALMVPTEILAEQHYATLTKMLDGLSVRVALLTGSVKGKKRAEILESLVRGDIHLLVATHAVLEDTVQFSALGFVVIDEQHRFGVAQRAKLWAKNNFAPHVLVMTATPIPRTLAMTLYGDLHVSIIDELPPGRKPVQTIHYSNQRRQAINQFIRQQIESGRQVYVVYPLIKENEKLDLSDLQNGYTALCETFPNYRISMVHGQMKASDKDEQMRRFASGETQILVATTVIEVGVNVPNASVMIIENAERFGLSQLHQLRGRVGRGAEQSYCILLTNVEQSKDTRKRMDIMVATNDGFRIAEADLQLRGPGDLEGTQQSGLPFELHIASLTHDGQILDLARQAAMEILDADPLLEEVHNRIYKQRLDFLRITAGNWGEIS